MSTFTISSQHSIGSLSHSNQTRKRNKRHANWKEGSKAVTIVGDMIVYIENPIDSTKKLLNLINEFGKTAGYRVNTQKKRHSCTPAMKLQKQKSGKKSHSI